MATNRPPEDQGYRALEILFNPWNTGYTSVSVLTVDYRGDRRVARRIGSVRLRVGRADLVGLAPSEVTALLVERLHEWLSDERRTLFPSSAVTVAAKRSPAPPEGVTGAAVDPLRTHTLPGL
jgi:hypothetical protein